MIKKIEGIIVGDTPFKDNSKILKVLTSDGKILSLMAKGVKNNKNILKSKTTKFTYGYFYIYYKEDKISTLTNVDIIDNFLNITNNLELISYLNYFVELAYNVCIHSPNSKIFSYLISSIRKINDGFDPIIIKDILELKYLDYLGISLNLDCCNKCGSKENIVSLSILNGGYICQNCLTDENITNIKTIKLIRNYYYVDIDSIKQINISESIKLEIDKLLDEMYEDYTGLYLKSKKFLKNVVNL